MTQKILSPMKSIRKKCLECSGTSFEIKYCQCVECPLWAYRLGEKPNRLTTIQYINGIKPEIPKKLNEAKKSQINEIMD